MKNSFDIIRNEIGSSFTGKKTLKTLSSTESSVLNLFPATPSQNPQLWH